MTDDSVKDAAAADRERAHAATAKRAAELAQGALLPLEASLEALAAKAAEKLAGDYPFASDVQLMVAGRLLALGQIRTSTLYLGEVKALAMFAGDQTVLDPDWPLG